MHTEICNYILISQIYPGRHADGFYLQDFLTNINDFKEKNTSEITSSIYSKHEYARKHSLFIHFIMETKNVAKWMHRNCVETAKKLFIEFNSSELITFYSSGKIQNTFKS